MTKTITFNELRRIKDSLPDGSMHRIADELNVTTQTVRNYFGGSNYSFGKNCGLHIEPGPDGGIVVLDNTQIYDMAIRILEEENKRDKLTMKKDRLITLAIHTYPKALILKGVLESQGIAVVIQNVNLLKPVISPGVRVRIHEKDLPHALEILETGVWEIRSF